MPTVFMTAADELAFFGDDLENLEDLTIYDEEGTFEDLEAFETLKRWNEGLPELPLLD